MKQTLPNNFLSQKRANNIKLPSQQNVQDLLSDKSNQETQKQFYLNKATNDLQVPLEDKEKYQGYEVSVTISKENSFDEAYQDKLIQFIKKFYFNGHFQLSLYLPHKLGVIEKEKFQLEFKDLQFQMKDIVFEKSDYLFYQKIYPFKGQEKFGISSAEQILIFDQFKFQDLAQEAQKNGYQFECNFQKLQCSIPTTNNTLHDIKKQMKFFVNNVQNTLDKYEIIVVETQTKQESNIKYKLIQQHTQKISQYLNTNIYPILINLNNLKQDSSKYLDKQFISKINKILKYDRLYLIVEKNDSDINLIQSEFKKYMNNKNNIQYECQEKQISFQEAPESEYLDQQLENLNKEFQNISIKISKPTLFQQNQLVITVSCETWQDSQKYSYNFSKTFPKIFAKLNQIYNPYIQIEIKEQDQISIWMEYLKGQLDESLKKHITEKFNQTRNEISKMCIISISTNLTKYEEQKESILENLSNLQLSSVEIINDDQQLQNIIAEINQFDFEKILNNFQKQEKEKIAQIKLQNIQQDKLQFRIIYNNNYSKKQMEDLIKNKFINDLKQKSINFPLISILDYLNLEIPKLIQEKDIISVIPKGNKQQVILIGRSLDFQQIEEKIKEIKKKYQENKMKIQLIIKQKSLADEIIKKLKQQKFCQTQYEPKTYTLFIEFFKQDFEIICNNLKDQEQSYGACKVLFLDVNEQKNIEIKEIEKNEQVIIDIQNFPIINPLTAEGFVLNIRNNKKIKFIQGDISQVKCQAIVLEFVKNVDFSKEIFQNDQIKNIVNQIQLENNKTELLSLLNQQSQQKDLEDVNCLQLSYHNNFHYLFQIYPKFYRQASNLASNLSHIKSLITQVFQQCKDNNITQIAFPLIQYGLYGYSLKAIQQVVIEEIITQLQTQIFQIQQVFVVIQKELDYKQIQEYCQNISNATIFNQGHPQNIQIPCCQILIDGDFIDIEDSDVNELINNKYLQLIKGEQQIEPFKITRPFSKFPFTHSIDLKNNKMIQKKDNIQSTIQFVDLFKQRIYFIDYQQVSQSLNQYLIIKHEQSKQNEFEIYYTQDEVEIINSSFCIKTNGFDDFKKINIKYEKQKQQNIIREFPITFQLQEQQMTQIDQNEQQQQKQQIIILSDKEQKNKMIMDQLLQITKKQHQRVLKRAK